MTFRTVNTFDDLLDEVGFGKYQIISTLLLCIPASLVNAWSFFNLVFMLYSPDHHCAKWNFDLSPNSTLIQNRLGNASEECDFEGTPIDNAEAHCQKWNYDNRYFDQTVKTQWDLVCERDPLSKHVLTIFVAFSIIGLGVMSIVQDYLGRKIAFLISLTLTLIGSGFSLLAPTFGAFVAIRSIQQTQVIASYNVPFVWAQEFVGPAKRTWVNFLMVLSYASGTVSLGFIAWACRTWIQLGLVTCAPFILLYSYAFLVDESPRWLLSVGKIDKATEIVAKMAVRNGRKADPDWIKRQLEIIGKVSIREREEEEKSKRVPIIELFRTYNLRTKIILQTFVWIANAAVYNTVAFNAARLGNLYVAYIIQAAVEAPACIIIVLLSNGVGRMPPVILAMFFSAAFSFLCVPAYVGEWNEWYVTIFAALSKFGVCVSWNILYQATGEMYPTTSRATGVAINCVIADAFIGVMPYILESASVGQWLPMFILGVLTLIGACCACVLPETNDQPMPQTADEAERVSKVGLQNIKIHLINLAKLCRKKKK